MDTAMNRIFPPRTLAAKLPQSRKVRPQPTPGLRDDTEAALREIAYVLHLTRRVKAEIRQERELFEAVMA
jgi:hypothetical protein